MRRIRKFLMRKQKGYAVTFEILFTIIILFALMSLTTYVLLAQHKQKQMYNVFISTAMQASKWGGNDTTLMELNGRTSTVSDSINRSLNSNVIPDFYKEPGEVQMVKVSPECITSPTDMIHVEVSWTDTSLNDALLTGQIGLGPIIGGEHKIKGDFYSVAKYGVLLKEAGLDG